MPTSAMPIDTQQMVHELTVAGIAQGQADAMVSVIAGTFGRYHAFLLDGVSTKCDLDHAVAGFKSDLDQAVTKFQSDLDHAVAGLKSDLDHAVARLDAKIDAVAAANDSAISRLKADLIKWIVSAGLFQGGLIVALMLKLAD